MRASLAACHARARRRRAAAEQRRSALALTPGFGVGEYLASLHYREPPTASITARRSSARASRPRPVSRPGR